MGSEQDNTLESKGSPKASLIAWWFRGYFCSANIESVLLLLLSRNYFAVPYRKVDTVESLNSWTVSGSV